MSAIGSIGSGIGSMVDAFGGPPDINVLSKVKWPALQKQIEGGLTQYGDIQKQGQTALSDFIKNYLAGTSAATAQTGQEVSALDRFYNGGVQQDLAGMRAAQEKARNEAVNVGAQQALKYYNQGAVTRGGMGSYDQRLLAGMLMPMRAQA